MKIKLSPVRMDEQLNASVIGDTIIINGLGFDFSPLQESEILPAAACNCSWISGDITRANGEICLTLILPHGAIAPQETRFPTAFYEPMTVTDGLVPLPPYDADPEAEPMQPPEKPEPKVTP